MSQKSIGEQRVRIEFNPSNDDKVFKIKQSSAILINMIEDLKSEKSNGGKDVVSGEFIRLCSLAQTAYEEAAMWAVKAATY